MNTRIYITPDEGLGPTASPELATVVGRVPSPGGKEIMVGTDRRAVRGAFGESALPLPIKTVWEAGR